MTICLHQYEHRGGVIIEMRSGGGGGGLEKWGG